MYVGAHTHTHTHTHTHVQVPSNIQEAAERRAHEAAHLADKMKAHPARTQKKRLVRERRTGDGWWGVGWGA